MPLPILHPLRQCPCAMLTMGILLATQPVILRNIILQNIPAEMLSSFPKATVPVLVLTDSYVIDESIDIMIWALKINDSANLLFKQQTVIYSSMIELINRNDNAFVTTLKKYKAATRYHDSNATSYRQQWEIFFSFLEHCLSQHEFIFGAICSLADYAILPFIRQFSQVFRKWFLQAPYP